MAQTQGAPQTLWFLSMFSNVRQHLDNKFVDKRVVVWLKIRVPMNQHNWSRFAFALISQNTGQRILAVHVGVYCNLRVTNVGLPPAATKTTNCDDTLGHRLSGEGQPDVFSPTKLWK